MKYSRPSTVVRSKELAASELFGHVKGAFTGALSDKKGQFEIANGGTLFLDEVGNLPYDVQVQLLRALEERSVRKVGSEKEIKVDVRVIAATNEKMAGAIDSQHFRLDLYHRLNEFELHLEPLRNRMEDLDEYLDFFLHSSNNELDLEVTGFAEEVVSVFKAYHWLCNLRIAQCSKESNSALPKGQIGLGHIPETLITESRAQQPNAEQNTPGYDLKNIREHQEKETIQRVLEEVRYNKSKAAELLNIDRSTLYNKISKYQIKA